MCDELDQEAQPTRAKVIRATDAWRRSEKTPVLDWVNGTRLAADDEGLDLGVEVVARTDSTRHAPVPVPRK